MKSVRIEKVCLAVTCTLLLQDGNTLLHYASSHGHTELCEFLLGAKANVEAKDKVLDATLAGQRCQSMTMIWAYERSGGRS